MARVKLLVGIQVRSESTRLPQKALLNYGKKPILNHVIDNAKHAIDFINRNPKNEIECKLALLVPKGDLIKDMVSGVEIVEGDAQDVLSRYILAISKYSCDYVMRITADCLYLFPHVISRHIKAMNKLRSDYTTNISFGDVKRTSMEGLDCEILSIKLLNWLSNNAVTKEHKEHVTSYINEAIECNEFPFTTCAVLDPFNLSYLKTSIDTMEDYRKALQNLNHIESSKKAARKYGEFII